MRKSFLLKAILFIGLVPVFVFAQIGNFDGGVAADLLGPPRDFAIAIIPVASDLQEGIPEEGKGMYMATNISLNNWQVIPPDEDSLNFGFTLNGPSGREAFFDFFIPNSKINFLSDL